MQSIGLTSSYPLTDISQRIRLMDQVSSRTGEIPVLASIDSHESIGQANLEPLGPLNDKLMDISFTGKPIQCGSQKVCDLVEKRFEFRQKKTLDAANAYKYVFDIGEWIRAKARWARFPMLTSSLDHRWQQLVRSV